VVARMARSARRPGCPSAALRGAPPSVMAALPEQPDTDDPPHHRRPAPGVLARRAHGDPVLDRPGAAAGANIMIFSCQPPARPPPNFEARSRAVQTRSRPGRSFWSGYDGLGPLRHVRPSRSNPVLAPSAR
jgi:hypothetical protein